VTHHQRLIRAAVIEALEQRARQFRSREDVAPFRVPHEPLELEAIVNDALAGGGRLDVADLRSRSVIRFEWNDGSAWHAWAINLPSGIFLYCDSNLYLHANQDETRVLASVKRGSADEADRFFLELLAESRGASLGIEMDGGAPDRVRTAIADRELLTDVFVELFEGTSAQQSIEHLTGHAADFRADVEQWLDRVLVAPTPSKSRARRPRRLRDEER
jgi:hypothetical protein